MSLDIYERVKIFSDLLETNIMFFKGELSETYYYGASWGKGEDQNDHAIISTKNLLILTKNRFFTINGQSSYTFMNEDKIEECKKYLYKINEDIRFYEKNNNYFLKYFDSCFYELKDTYKKAFEKLEKEENKITKQRSFLEFFIEESTFLMIKNKLKEDERLWYCILTPDNKILTNMPSRKICLTDDYSIFTIDLLWREFAKSSYKNIDSILDKMYLCMICCRDFSTFYTADDILVQYLNITI